MNYNKFTTYASSFSSENNKEQLLEHNPFSSENNKEQLLEHEKKGIWCKSLDKKVGQIIKKGFHLADYNPLLIKYYNEWVQDKKANNQLKRILIPLCGKSKDILYLNLIKNHYVTAVDGVYQAFSNLNKKIQIYYLLKIIH